MTMFRPYYLNYVMLFLVYGQKTISHL